MREGARFARAIAAVAAVAMVTLAGARPSSAAGDPPVAVGDSYATMEDTELSVAAPGVLGNDSDPEGDPLTAALVTPPGNGTATLNADGSFTYTPVPGFSGPDAFTYVANDGTSDSNEATVTITVETVGEPVALDNAYVTLVGQLLDVPAPGVLGNDSDPEGDPLTAVLVTPPDHGELTLNADGSFTYAPDPGFSGTDLFTYQASDGTLLSNEATVTITVQEAEGGDPVAVDDSYSTGAGQVLTVPAPGVLANDFDPEGDPLTVTTLTPGPGTEGGTFDLASDGALVYTPPADPPCGTVDTFQYAISDGAGGTDTAQISVTITSGEAQPATLTLARSATLVEYARVVTITARLTGSEFALNKVISIFRIPHGGPKTLLAEGEVDESGAFSATKKLFKRNSFVAEWAGDGCLDPSTSPRKAVLVKARTTGALSGHYGMSGPYKLFHDNQNPFYRGTAKPNHGGLALWFVLQNRPAAKWKLVFNQKFTMAADSSVGGAIQGLGRGTYRIRAVFRGDPDHARDESRWALFKVTA